MSTAEQFFLQWRGQRVGPWDIHAIRAALNEGSIHSLYQIHAGGTWQTLRDFLEASPRLVRGPSPKEDYEARLQSLQEELHQARAQAATLAETNARLQAAPPVVETLHDAPPAASKTQFRLSQSERPDSAQDGYLRMPNASSAPQSAFPMILKFGEVYPLTIEDGSLYPGLRGIRRTNDSMNVYPKKAEGLRAVKDAPRLLAMLRNLKTAGGYLTVYVYPDSMDIFRKFKQTLQESGVEFGFRACAEHELLIFNTPDFGYPEA